MNLKYLVTQEVFCPDWRKLKSTLFKMDVLEITESEVNLHITSYCPETKQNQSIEFLSQLDFRRKTLGERLKK